jgi:hypothetical protein
MPPPQVAQRARPVSNVGPLTILGGVFLGLRSARFARTCSRVAESMTEGTLIGIHSDRSFTFRERLSTWLK